MHDGTCLVGQVIIVKVGRDRSHDSFKPRLKAWERRRCWLARLRMPANMSVAMTSRQR